MKWDRTNGASDGHSGAGWDFSTAAPAAPGASGHAGSVGSITAVPRSPRRQSAAGPITPHRRMLDATPAMDAGTAAGGRNQPSQDPAAHRHCQSILPAAHLVGASILPLPQPAAQPIRRRGRPPSGHAAPLHRFRRRPGSLDLILHPQPSSLFYLYLSRYLFRSKRIRSSSLLPSSTCPIHTSDSIELFHWIFHWILFDIIWHHLTFFDTAVPFL